MGGRCLIGLSFSFRPRGLLRPVLLPRCYRCILYLFFILCSRCLLSWLCGRKLSEDPKEYKRPCGRMKARRKCWRFAGDEVRHCHVTFLLDLYDVAELALAASGPASTPDAREMARTGCRSLRMHSAFAAGATDEPSSAGGKRPRKAFWP